MDLNKLYLPIGDLLGDSLETMPESQLKYLNKRLSEDASFMNWLIGVPAVIIIGTIIEFAATAQSSLVHLVQSIHDKGADTTMAKYIIKNVEANKDKYAKLAKKYAKSSSDITSQFGDVLLAYIQDPTKDPKMVVKTFKNLYDSGKNMVARDIGVDRNQWGIGD